MGQEEGRRWRVFNPILGAFFCLLGTFMLLKSQTQVLFVALVLVSGLYLLVADNLLTPLLWRIAYRRHHTGLQRASTLSFEPENIRCEIPGISNSTIEWQAIQGAIEGERTVLLYLSPTCFIYIPKRILSNHHRDILMGLLIEKQIRMTYPSPRKQAT